MHLAIYNRGINKGMMKHTECGFSYSRFGNSYLLAGIKFSKREGAAMLVATNETVQDLAFAHWQYNANEKAYSANLITKAMYEYARDELHKDIESLSAAHYK